MVAREKVFEMSWGPIVGMIIAIAGMFFALAIGYVIGYNDAKDGK